MTRLFKPFSRLSDGPGETAAQPRIVHIIDRLDTGGMEAVAANVIEGTLERYHHAVICLSGYGALAGRLRARGIQLISLGKRRGKDAAVYARLWAHLRRLKPDLVQTYNIGAIDAAPVARLAGVRRVVHAEHGRDASDPHGRSRKYRRLRRLLAPAIDEFVAVSDDLSRWLTREVGIRRSKVRLVYNGVDTQLYRPAGAETVSLDAEFAPPGTLVIGTIGRLDRVKAHGELLKAFARARDNPDTNGAGWRLAVVGDGPEKPALERLASELGIEDAVWLAGERHDAPRLLRGFDVYVCSSIAEGISLTILEAMSSALPVIATSVGGNPELVCPGETGALIPASKTEALVAALRDYLADAGIRRRQGEAGRERVQRHFSLSAMTSAYCALYDQLLGVGRHAAPKPVKAR